MANERVGAVGAYSVPPLTPEKLAAIRQRAVGYADAQARADAAKLLGELELLQSWGEGSESSLPDVEYRLVKSRAEVLGEPVLTDCWLLLWEIDRLRGELGVEAGARM